MVGVWEICVIHCTLSVSSSFIEYNVSEQGQHYDRAYSILSSLVVGCSGNGQLRRGHTIGPLLGSARPAAIPWIDHSIHGMGVVWRGFRPATLTIIPMSLCLNVCYAPIRV